MVISGKYIFTALMILLMAMTLPGVGLAQNAMENETPKWFHETAARDYDMVVSRASAENFPIALGKAIEKLYIEKLERDEKAVVSQNLGPIKISQLNKNLVGFNGKDNRQKTLATKIIYTDNNGELTLKLFDEEINNIRQQKYEIEYDGMVFAGMIQKLDSLGIEIKKKSTLTKSYVRLLVPEDLVPE